MEALLESGRQRLEGLIDKAISDGRARGGGGDGAEGGAGAELTRLWEEGKEQLAELAGKGGEVRANRVDCKKSRYVRLHWYLVWYATLAVGLPL